MGSKIAVITGASSGIGLLTALELARSGYSVVATMRNPMGRTALDEAAAKAGVQDRIDVRRLDITESASVAPAIEEIVQHYGRIDVLVNNAGFAMAGFADDVALEELRTQFDTNFFGHVAVTLAVLPHMRRQQSGHIIMVSSIAGRAAHPGIGSYSASKFALEGWSEALRLEMTPLGIRVVLVEPGSYETNIWEKNVHIASAAFSDGSPNKERSRRFAEHVKTQVVKRDAREVARLIARVAAMPYPRLRYLVGKDARLYHWVRLLMPWKRYEKMVAKTVGI